ncbi:MAG: shikimate kinase [Spirochaetaceae bacterium]|nr:shikimate kinase [Spirochaetaceae bacterium]
MAFIVLLGPKHSGKTSAGAALARRLTLQFYDLDMLIEERTGKSPRTLYRAGPEIFRREEVGALTALLDKTGGGILAGGGGIIDNPPALSRLQDHVTVALEVSAETAWARIAGGGKELPPFLRGESMEASKEKHRILHEERSGAYRIFARYRICAEGKSSEELAAELCRLVQGAAGL